MTKPKNRTEEIPKSWRKGKPSRPSKKHSFSLPKLRKIHVPAIGTAWRVLVALLLVVNFFIAQATLLSAPQTQPMFWFFFLNFVVFLWTLWATRRA